MARVEKYGRHVAFGWSVLAGTIAMVIVAGGIPFARAAVDLEERFAMLDEDGDGVVTRDEFLRNKTQIFFVTLEAAGAEKHLRPQDTPLTADVFARADIDRDGMLSGAEFVQASFMQFEAFDADGDGTISLGEFLAAARQFVADDGP